MKNLFLIISFGLSAVATSFAYTEKDTHYSQSACRPCRADMIVAGGGRSIFSIIIKSILIGGLTGSAARVADQKIFPFIGFLTEPAIRKFLLEELLLGDEQTSSREIEIAYWFSWISAWVTWYSVY